VSRESKIDNQLGALRENLSYNIALLFIKKKKAGSKNVRFELILNPTDFLTLMGNDQIYVEVKSSINKEFVLERAQIDFILNPSNKVELIFVDYSLNEDLKYDIEWIKVYEININNLSYYQWKVKMEDEIKAGECNLRELLNE
jgi:cytochrome c biogenesis factor